MTGEQLITFLAATSTTFQQITPGTFGIFSGVYLWSNASNWTGGLPTNGSTVVWNFAGSAGNPAGYDNIANLYLDTITLTSGYLAISTALTVGTVAFGAAEPDQIFTDTLAGTGPATLTIDAITGTNGGIGAAGTGAVTYVNTLTDPGEQYFALENGEVVLTAAPNASSYLEYSNTFATATLAFKTLSGTVGAALTGVEVGDSLALPGSSVDSVTFGASSMAIVTNLGTTTFSNVSYGTTKPESYTVGTDPITGEQMLTFTVCFCKGSLIATPTGNVEVENLSVGDMVTTWSGAVRPIVWIGTGKVLATRGRRNAATPVIVRKGALADNVPHRDLRVTKGHSLHLDGVLIPVEFLVNHRSIIWDDRAQEVELYHIELETHDVLLANGAPAESYRDDGNRWLFQNTNSGWDLPAQTPCAPVLTGGPVVDALWRRLLDRDGARPGFPLTDEPDLHLLADGERLDEVRRRGDVHVFKLRSPPASLRIVSRSAAPDQLGLARDPRSLGVALRRITLSRGARLRVVEADDLLLTEGFHAFEADNGFRWTDGDAVLPAALFAGFDGAIEVELHVGCTAHYVEQGALRQVA